MRFEWNPQKAASNLRKHGVDFELAQEVFEDKLAVTESNRVVDGEQRWSSVGSAYSGKLLFVVFAVDESGEEDIVRIISARKATRPERRDYERGA